MSTPSSPTASPSASPSASGSNIWSDPNSSSLLYNAAGPTVVTVTQWVGPTTQPESSSPGPQIPIGAIVGGTVAGIAIVALAVGGWILWGRSIKKQSKEKKRQSQIRESKRPSRPSMKHVSASTGSSSWMTKDGKAVSFEIVSPTAAVPVLSKTAPPRKPPPRNAPPRRHSGGAIPTAAAATVIVTPPAEDVEEQPRVMSPERPEKSPYRNSRRQQAIAHTRTGSSGSYRPSPLSRAESFVPSTPSTPQLDLEPTPTKTPTPPPPTPPFLRRSPTGAKTKTTPSLVALHAAATTPTPNLSLLTQNDGRVNRLSTLSTMQPASPHEWQQHPTPQLPPHTASAEEEDHTIWRGSRVEMTPSPDGDDDNV